MSATAEASLPNGSVPQPAESTSPYLEAVAVGVRVVGLVVAVAYLTGLVPGPLLAAVGGLALVTFGRGLLLERTPAVIAGAAFAVIVAALVAGALRWTTLELEELRGIQAVLGPTVLVEKTASSYPNIAPIAAWVAVVAAVIGIAVWLRFPRGEVWFSLLPWAAETVVAALGVATIFWGPASSAFGSGDAGEIATELGRWALVTLAVALPAAGLSYLLARLDRLWTFVALGVAAAAALSAAGLLSPSV